ncbi:hypothetical protein RF679_09345 [Undibacterium cyanobacteriorum]|uniref:Regulatory protein, RpfE type n=1 Tax=Undibacterium cyanobacteriorum TaxID=3073561 RepID=A0ABY9RP47_9BURK|nr:hypothetical protein [Undibacterium sp. 20NA77.5]WMW82464.1 hypothetical protein RF679_09345 [Undibacterium sp. 20NA77.5]
MSHLEIILPFGIPPASLAKQLLQQVNAPSLQRLLSFAKASTPLRLNEFARLLPHEYFLFERDSISQKQKALEAQNVQRTPDQEQRYTSPRLSISKMLMHGLATPAASGYWFTLTPVHIHIARDHLVMTDPRRLQVSEAHARQLFLIAQEICQERGHELIFASPSMWFLRADTWRELQTASLDAAAGHNMDIWMPEGEQARNWRKLQNEIQMAWHNHAANLERENVGLVPINSVWIHGGSDQAHHVSPQTGMASIETFLHQLKNPSSTKPLTPIIIIEDLLEPALNSDWGSWLNALQQLEDQCFSPLWQALQNGELDRLNLGVSDHIQFVQFECKKPSWLQTFRKPHFNKLLALAASNHL